MTLRSYQPVAWVLYQRVIDQSKADVLIKPGINTYPFVLFHLAITFHILLRLTDSDYSFRILKLSLSFVTYLCILLVCLSDQWCSHGIPVSSTNKTDRHDITEILLKVALNTITRNPNHTFQVFSLIFTSFVSIPLLTDHVAWKCSCILCFNGFGMW